MNRDDIIRIAQEAGWEMRIEWDAYYDFLQRLERFAALVAAEQPKPEPVAKVELMTTGGNAGLATRIVEIDDPLRDRLSPGQFLYVAPPDTEALRRENERLRDELRQSGIDYTRAEVERLRDALKVCLTHWLRDDNPDELQEDVARLKEFCHWEAALRREGT